MVLKDDKIVLDHQLEFCDELHRRSVDLGNPAERSRGRNAIAAIRPATRIRSGPPEVLTFLRWARASAGGTKSSGSGERWTPPHCPAFSAVW
jgi:hypothetical protein